MEFAKFRIRATTRADNTSLMSGMEINSFFALTVFAHTVRVSPELRKFVFDCDPEYGLPKCDSFEG